MGKYAPAHIVSVPGANGKYTVKWDNLKKDTVVPDGSVAEADIMVPQFQVSLFRGSFGSVWIKVRCDFC
jgi:hypothetical protein